jgi:4'-phosphopantetheinyl transferase
VVAGADPTHDRVDVWRVSLDADDRLCARLLGDLAPAEVERLHRLGRSEIARRWLLSRAALRGILATELGVPASGVRLKAGVHGRPELDRETHPVDLDFNLSHSADLALVATGRGLRVGVDVERLRRGRDPLRLADRYFAPAEVASLRALTPADLQPAFFRYWTAKEALAKGLGLGLRAPLRDIELVHKSDGRMAPIRLGGDWRLVELTDLPSGYCGALAVEGGVTGIVARDWRFAQPA